MKDKGKRGASKNASAKQKEPQSKRPVGKKHDGPTDNKRARQTQPSDTELDDAQAGMNRQGTESQSRDEFIQDQPNRQDRVDMPDANVDKSYRDVKEDDTEDNYKNIERRSGRDRNEPL